MRLRCFECDEIVDVDDGAVRPLGCPACSGSMEILDEGTGKPLMDVLGGDELPAEDVDAFRTWLDDDGKEPPR